MGAPDIVAFLSDLAVRQNVSLSTQRQAQAALVFLYRDVLGLELEGLAEAVRARSPRVLPTVLCRGEVKSILETMTGTHRLIATILYGGGLRLIECLRLRIKDLDFDRQQIGVRQGNGRKDRFTTLPMTAADPIREHLDVVRGIHQQDLTAGFGRVPLPYALDRKLSNAASDWSWQWVFPATRISRDRRTGHVGRHHLHETTTQKAVRSAAKRVGITKRVTTHTFRHHADSRIMPTLSPEASL